MKNKVNKGGQHLKNTGLPSRNSAGHKTGHGTRHNVRIHIVGGSSGSRNGSSGCGSGSCGGCGGRNGTSGGGSDGSGRSGRGSSGGNVGSSGCSSSGSNREKSRTADVSLMERLYFQWVNTLSAFWWKPSDDSNGIPCPGVTDQNCLPGFRCQKHKGKIVCIESLDKIAFEAYTTNSRGYYFDGKVLVFPNVLLNDGQGYNPKTGLFKAPVAGVYKFTVHVCSAPNKHMVVAIVKGDEEQIAVTMVFEEPSSSCTSHSVITRLEKNEIVMAKVRYDESYLESDEYRWPSFSGFLMYSY
ncbi:complement C1q tumor necrosis factor-related protein 7-like [Ruditapes philippinarum]|uniref:complement C1q tumor necrosis factor-related protein 7-like n=1 Tax=Ruditapes philippinarum TaxID=129788 RepID=UPI00295B322A|nr:complement C1q tumor necrosis factor-related protein 7-like [Ruditapes philippinarum]